MIVLGLTGGMRQGKSTVGELLRGLAGVDYKADLETSYPISEVANNWISSWPVLPTTTNREELISLANGLIESLPKSLELVTGKLADPAKLKIGDSPASHEEHKQLIKYLELWTGLTAQERDAQLPLPITAENKVMHRPLLMWLGGGMIELVAPTIWCDLLDRRIKQLGDRGYSLVTVGGIRYPQDARMIASNFGFVVRVVRPDTERSNNITETVMQELHPDVVIYNDDSLNSLEKTCQMLWTDLKNGNLQTHYRASHLA
ncbi:MAG: hypothetical protein ACHQUB_01485 [Candidatus Saccharimonadia bacterium]